MGMLKDPNKSAIKIIILVFSKFHYKVFQVLNRTV